MNFSYLWIRLFFTICSVNSWLNLFKLLAIVVVWTIKMWSSGGCWSRRVGWWSLWLILSGAIVFSVKGVVGGTIRSYNWVYLLLLSTNLTIISPRIVSSRWKRRLRCFGFFLGTSFIRCFRFFFCLLLLSVRKTNVWSFDFSRLCPDLLRILSSWPLIARVHHITLFLFSSLTFLPISQLLTNILLDIRDLPRIIVISLFFGFVLPFKMLGLLHVFSWANIRSHFCSSIGFHSYVLSAIFNTIKSSHTPVRMICSTAQNCWGPFVFKQLSLRWLVLLGRGLFLRELLTESLSHNFSILYR